MPDFQKQSIVLFSSASKRISVCQNQHSIPLHTQQGDDTDCWGGTSERTERGHPFSHGEYPSGKELCWAWVVLWVWTKPRTQLQMWTSKRNIPRRELWSFNKLWFRDLLSSPEELHWRRLHHWKGNKSSRKLPKNWMVTLTQDDPKSWSQWEQQSQLQHVEALGKAGC